MKYVFQVPDHEKPLDNKGHSFMPPFEFKDFYPPAFDTKSVLGRKVSELSCNFEQKKLSVKLKNTSCNFFDPYV